MTQAGHTPGLVSPEQDAGVNTSLVKKISRPRFQHHSHKRIKLFIGVKAIFVILGEKLTLEGDLFMRAIISNFSNVKNMIVEVTTGM